MKKIDPDDDKTRWIKFPSSTEKLPPLTELERPKRKPRAKPLPLEEHVVEVEHTEALIDCPCGCPVEAHPRSPIGEQWRDLCDGDVACGDTRGSVRPVSIQWAKHICEVSKFMQHWKKYGGSK